MGFTFDVSKCDCIFDELLKLEHIKLSHAIPPLDELKQHAYCKWHNSFSHATNDCNVLRRQIQSAVNEGRLVVPPQMQVDKNSFPAHMHMLELSTPKVLIRPSQAKSTNGKNIIIGEKRSEPSKHNQKESREFPLKDSTLWGQEEKRCARFVKTGLETDLTGPSGNSAKKSQ